MWRPDSITTAVLGLAAPSTSRPRVQLSQQSNMKLCGINTTIALLACLQCSIAGLNALLVLYALILFTVSLLFLLWMEYYISHNSKLAFTVVVFMISIALSIFCFSCLACPCILRTKTHKVFSYLVSSTHKIVQN